MISWCNFCVGKIFLTIVEVESTIFSIISNDRVAGNKFRHSKFLTLNQFSKP